MIRTQIQLNGKRHRKLQETAREQGQSMAEMVRSGVDLALALCERRKKWERARSLVGTFASGHKDVSEKHDHYLSEAINDGKRESGLCPSGRGNSDQGNSRQHP